MGLLTILADQAQHRIAIVAYLRVVIAIGVVFAERPPERAALLLQFVRHTRRKAAKELHFAVEKRILLLFLFGEKMHALHVISGFLRSFLGACQRPCRVCAHLFRDQNRHRAPAQGSG
ncbi:hypothetical protein SDC9_143507 [bioreactor metagenome]|uniref:Uncharacterized protein n=1 Tax=bioreactor metagenome TaxID=1076179 RepID=A0A645E3R0_9ZZZZ